MNNISFRNEKIDLKFYFFSISLKAFFDFLYVKVISFIYGYDGFTLDFNLLKFFEGWIIYFLILYIFPKKG